MLVKGHPRTICAKLFPIRSGMFILTRRIFKNNFLVYVYILNKSENATLQLSIFCEKYSTKRILLELNNVS